MDGLQQQNTTLGFTPVNKKQQSEVQAQTYPNWTSDLFLTAQLG